MADLAGVHNVGRRLLAATVLGGGMALLGGRGAVSSFILTGGIVLLAVSSGVVTLWSN